MATAPTWAISLAYWIHMLATVLWIGGLAALSALIIPAARSSLEPEQYAKLLGALQRRLDPLAWLCLAALFATGLLQMSANENYNGFLAIDSPWAIAILVKHLLIILMIGISAALTWGVLPGLRRAALLQAHGRNTPEISHLQRRETWMLRINLILGVLVLALTAIARAS